MAGRSVPQRHSALSHDALAEAPFVVRRRETTFTTAGQPAAEPPG